MCLVRCISSHIIMNITANIGCVDLPLFFMIDRLESKFDSMNIDAIERVIIDNAGNNQKTAQNDSFTCIRVFFGPKQIE